MSLAIREMREGDEAALVALWAAAGNLVPWNPPEADIARAMAARDCAILVGERDGRIIASVMVGFDGHRAWPYYVAVDPPAQGSGAGRAIMAAAEAWAQARGAPKMMLMVRPGNDRARGFYAALGYAEERRVLMSKWLDGRPGNPSAAIPQVETVVTYLQMTARPTRPTVPLPAGPRLSVQRAVQPPLPFYRFLYNTVGADWDWTVRRSMSDEALAAIIHDPLVEVFVLSVDGAPGGYCELDRRREATPGAGIEIAYFGLLPWAVGRGLGWWFLNWAVDQAWSYNPARVWLHTCDLDHPRALPNYQRAGFVPFDRKTETQPDGRYAIG
ncbi:MAG: hypothetical protein OHK0024_04820 [Thalassobaculales bacterium]